MSTLIIIFIAGYVFHWIYKGIDKLFSVLYDLRKKKEDM